MGEAVLFSTDKETAYLLKVAYLLCLCGWLLENYLHLYRSSQIETWNWIPYWFPDKCRLSTYLPVILTTFKKSCWWLVRSSCTLKFQNLKFFQKEFFLKNHNLINDLLFLKKKNEKYGFQKTSQSQRHLWFKSSFWRIPSHSAFRLWIDLTW